MQTVVLDYIQSEINLKSSRDKSELGLASKCSPAPHCSVSTALLVIFFVRWELLSAFVLNMPAVWAQIVLLKMLNSKPCILKAQHASSIVTPLLAQSVTALHAAYIPAKRQSGQCVFMFSYLGREQPVGSVRCPWLCSLLDKRLRDGFQGSHHAEHHRVHE